MNEIFRRLNTGGIPLTQIELVLSKIKSHFSDFEEKLESLSDDITAATGGFEFASAELLQFIHLLAFETARVEADRVKESDIALYNDMFEVASPAIRDFFESYLWDKFRINSRNIVPRPFALLPLIAYTVGIRTSNGLTITKMGDSQLRVMHQYFILSQAGDWNTQTMVTRFSKLAHDAGKAGTLFPLDAIKAQVRNRSSQLQYNNFLWEPWFALKILAPTRTYLFSGAKPQVDHIFPLHLKGGGEAYRKRVDVLWNFQPTPAGVNNLKRAKHPFDFFMSAAGKQHFDQYDYVPTLADEFTWKDDRRFIWRRKRKMLNALKNRYGLKLSRTG